MKHSAFSYTLECTSLKAPWANWKWHNRVLPWRSTPFCCPSSPFTSKHKYCSPLVWLLQFVWTLRSNFFHSPFHSISIPFQSFRQLWWTYFPLLFSVLQYATGFHWKETQRSPIDQSDLIKQQQQQNYPFTSNVRELFLSSVLSKQQDTTTVTTPTQ